MWTITTAAVRGTTNVITFPEPDDDKIPFVTGITLANTDAKVIARRLRQKTWKQRARFFNNITAESIDHWGKIDEIAPSKEASHEFLDWAAIEMARRASARRRTCGASP